MKTFLTSDNHYKHTNVLGYCNRPFKNTYEMEKTLIKNWNSVVSPDDLVINLGDLCFHGEKHKDWYSWLNQQLNGRHVLVVGNHDVMKPFKYTECGFESVHTSLIIDDIILVHNPNTKYLLQLAQDKGYSIFCGHVHNHFKKLVNPINILNVGCDVWNYTPVEWNVAKAYLYYGKPDEGITLDAFDDQRLNSMKERAVERKKKYPKKSKQLSLF